jgi:hypothetical protein
MKVLMMKKTTTRRSTANKANKGRKSSKRAIPSAAKGKVSGGKVAKQPQVKQQAAVAHGMFLYTDDAWSLRYFDQNDLHFLEREVFG